MSIARAHDTPRADAEFEQQVISLAGRTLVADKSGALYWPSLQTLVVADLHFEKGSAHAERGSFLPPYDTRTTLGRLLRTIDYFDPETVIALGDSLHDSRAGERLAEEDLELIRALQVGRTWHWITGNHDPEIPQCLGGTVSDAVTLGGLVFRHEPQPGPRGGEIAGHMHPAARITRHGYSLRRPCFVSNGRRLVLPAFGSFTGGLNVLDGAFEPILGRDGLYVWMIGHEGVYPVAARQLGGE